MSVDLLNEQKEIKKVKTSASVLWHRPNKEAPVVLEPVKPVKKEKKFNALLFIIIFVIIVLIGIAAYFIFFRLKPQPPIINQIIETPSPTPVVSTPSPLPTPSPSPSPSPSLTVKPLPDTELAPLRGAVINFAGENTLYLIENNGELRWIDRKTVSFENGQSINEISPSLIYTLPDRWKYIRRGENVYGLVDWDPRVLLVEELAPFL